jgi:hypothetical protein
MIAMAAGLSEDVMATKPDEPFAQPVTLQPFHIDGMVRLATAWRTINTTSVPRMRELARKRALNSPREVMDFVRELFAEGIAPDFWIDVFKSVFKPEEHANLIIDDVDTEDERAYLRGLEGLLVGISRPGYEADLTGCDLVIVNDGTPQQLQDLTIAAIFGHLRGVPMDLANGDRVVVQQTSAVDLDAARQAKETETLRRRIEDMQLTAEKAVREREARIKELSAALEVERARLVETDDEELAELRARVQALTGQLQSQAAAPTGPARPAAPSSGRETDTASLVARLSLALGYEAGLGKLGSEPMICVDLPAGQVVWPVGDAAYPFLPRYDKAIDEVTDEERRARILNPDVSVALTTERALEREDSQLAILACFLQDLILLAEGCKVHRAYRAKRPPTGDCPTCWAMWEAGERLSHLTGFYAPVPRAERELTQDTA